MNKTSIPSSLHHDAFLIPHPLMNEKSTAANGGHLSFRIFLQQAPICFVHASNLCNFTSTIACSLGVLPPIRNKLDVGKGILHRMKESPLWADHLGLMAEPRQRWYRVSDHANRVVLQNHGKNSFFGRASNKTRRNLGTKRSSIN